MPAPWGFWETLEASGASPLFGRFRRHVAVRPAVARRQLGGDPVHDQVRCECLRLLPRRGRPGARLPAGTGVPTRIVAWPPGRGRRRPFGQTRSVSAMPIGTIGAPVRRASIARPSFGFWSSPVGLRVPSGKIIRTWPSFRTRSAVRNASTSAASAIDRMDAAVAGHPADDRPVEHLLLPEPVDPAAESLASAMPRGSRHPRSRCGWRRG